MNPPPPGFTGAPIDRADNLRLAGDRIDALADAAEARLMRLAGVEPLFGAEGRLDWIAIAERGADVELLFLGISAQVPLFAPLSRITPTAERPASMFAILEAMHPEDAALWGVARSLIEWHNRHGFCGHCGAATIPFRAGWGRRCTGCTTEHFPRVDPVVIMLAEHEDKVLVGRQPRFPPNRYSALAGFVEPGESIEEAVARELKEEAGVEVGAVRYIASQPWPFPGQLMIGCIAHAHSTDITLDTNELEDAMWVDRAGIAAVLAGEHDAPFVAPPHFAIAHTLLARWAAGA